MSSGHLIPALLMAANHQILKEHGKFEPLLIHLYRFSLWLSSEVLNLFLWIKKKVTKETRQVGIEILLFPNSILLSNNSPRTPERNIFDLKRSNYCSLICCSSCFQNQEGPGHFRKARTYGIHVIFSLFIIIESNNHHNWSQQESEIRMQPIWFYSEEVKICF